MKKILTILLAALVLSGCARNTNSVSIGGTGLFVEAFGSMIALGNFEAHVATSDLSSEQLVVTDTKFFEGSGVLGTAADDGLSSTLGTQRAYSMTVHPVEGTPDESR